MELKLEDIKLYLKNRQNFDDLVEILKLYRTDDIKRACQKVLKARKKEKSKLEKWLEEHHLSYYEKYGCFPHIRDVRKLVRILFKIPTRKNGRFPSHIEYLIFKVNRRIRQKIRRKRLREMEGKLS